LCRRPGGVSNPSHFAAGGAGGVRHCESGFWTRFQNNSRPKCKWLANIRFM